MYETFTTAECASGNEYLGKTNTNIEENAEEQEVWVVYPPKLTSLEVNVM